MPPNPDVIINSSAHRALYAKLRHGEPLRDDHPTVIKEFNNLDERVSVCDPQVAHPDGTALYYDDDESIELIPASIGSPAYIQRRLNEGLVYTTMSHADHVAGQLSNPASNILRRGYENSYLALKAGLVLCVARVGLELFAHDSAVTDLAAYGSYGVVGVGVLGAIALKLHKPSNRAYRAVEQYADPDNPIIWLASSED